jgi:hypothetical protein
MSKNNFIPTFNILNQYHKKLVFTTKNYYDFTYFNTIKKLDLALKTYCKLKLHIHTNEYLEKLKEALKINEIKVYFPPKSRLKEDDVKLYTLFKQYQVDLDNICYIDCFFEDEFVKKTFFDLLTQNNICFSNPINNSTHIPNRDDSLTGKTIIWKEKEEKIKYPLYVISKGRYNYNHTANFLIKSNIDFYLVVESDEYDLYKKNIDEKYLLKVLNYSKRKCGSVPVRNFVFRHSKENGYNAHWILDDNIYGFELIYKAKKLRCYNSCIFTMIEKFFDLHKNIGMIGHNYSMFCIGTNNPKPLIKNAHLYSSMLINNDIYEDCKTKNIYPIKNKCGKMFNIVEYGIWREKYNEDVDLNIRCIKNNWNVISTNTIVSGKATTKRLNGGNSDTIYKEDDFSYHKTMSLVNQHPNYVECVKKYNRFHHLVNWNKLQRDYPNELELKDEIECWKFYEGQPLNKRMNDYNFTIE